MVLVVTVAIVTPVSATDPNADALIARGLELRRSGQSVEALALFQRAHGIEPTPRTFGQMGLVEASLQRWVDAEAHLDAAVAAAADPWVAGNRKLLDKALALVRQHIGELAVQGPPGTRLQVSGYGMKLLPLTAPLRVAAGDIRVSAIAAGYKQLIQVVRVEAGKRTSLVLNLVPYHQEPSTPRNGTAGEGAGTAGQRR